MNFEPILYGPLFIRDAQDINLVAASADSVNLTVSVGGSSWTIPVTPVLTNNRYLAALRMREILNSVVGIPGLANAGEREVPLVTLSAGDATMSVRAVYGAASGKTPTQLAGHWLSWRDQVSMTHAWGRERLTFLAGLDLLGWQSGTYSVKAKIFLSSGDPVTVTLASGTLQSGCRYVTVDASYATIAAAVSSSVRSKIRAWDVSYSFSGTDSQSAAATINGYPLRLIIARDEVRVKEFVFCNSFGVEDRVYSSGRSNPKLDGSSVAFLSGATEYELRNDSTEGREVYSGRLGSARESALWLDFLKAHDRYILASGGLARIIVDSQETDLQDNALGSVKFIYHLGALDNGRYFNDQEGLGDYDPTQRHGALYIGDEPPSEELPSEDLFFLKTRLDEFPVADISEEYLFLVQDPLTLEWCSAPLSDIKEWLQQVIIHEDVHVWSGPWEQYSDAFADYALAAHLGKDLLDRVVALERDLPTGLVQSVAGVGPDEDGDVDADALKDALGLKSAAYREEGYFARASHTHGISDITGLDGNLSTISSALQSLQAQIDSVASRDSFDELTASSAFIDMLAADDVYANRYHFTPDIFFSFELIDGVPAVRLNAALITAGDQVLGDGTPGGGGGGGGSSYLYELLDVDDDLSAPVVGTLLQWYGGEWVGTTFSDIANGDLLTYAAGKWSNVPRTSVGIVTDATSSAHGLMSAADKSKLDSINTTHISHGETAYNALDVIGPALQSLQAQIDSVASRDSFDELTATALCADVLTASDIYGTLHGALDGNAGTATDADKLDGQHGSYYATASAVSTLQGYFTNGVANNADKLDGIHAADLFSALGSGAAANLSLTIGGTTRTATLYATYDSASENISDKFGIVGGALQSLQSQIDAVASRADISDFEATTEAKMDYMCDLMRSLQSQIDSVSTRINDGSDAYYDILSVGKAIYGDVLITTGEQTLSDERFKTITREIVLTAEEIASCRAVAFDWKHKPGSSFGSIAQDWQKILPEAVSDSGDELYLFYSQSAEVAVINLAREVVRLKKILGINN